MQFLFLRPWISSAHLVSFGLTLMKFLKGEKKWEKRKNCAKLMTFRWTWALFFLLMFRPLSEHHFMVFFRRFLLWESLSCCVNIFLPKLFTLFFSLFSFGFLGSSHVNVGNRCYEEICCRCRCRCAVFFVILLSN